MLDSNDEDNEEAKRDEERAEAEPEPEVEELLVCACENDVVREERADESDVASDDDSTAETEEER